MTSAQQSKVRRKKAIAVAPAAATISLDIVEDAGAWTDSPPLETAIHKAAAALARHPRIQHRMPVAACLALSDDAAVQKLNGAYRAKDKPTNVLSFPATRQSSSHDDNPPFIGDVILAEETVRREAADLGLPVLHHVQHLVVHGLLHLLGYDHETEDDASTMEDIETETLASIGVSDPYSHNETTEPTS